MTLKEDQKIWLLDATDRCDSCYAQAYVKVISHSGELLFCSHHYNKVVDDAVGYKKIMKFMVEVIDERARLK